MRNSSRIRSVVGVIPLPIKVAVFHAWGIMLSPLRQRPSVFIIGAQKSGTTSIYDYLGFSSGFRKARLKEIGYYTTQYERPNMWYRGFFPLRTFRGGWSTGEATPEYLFDPHTPVRLARDYPQASLVVLLRDPVIRAYSHWRHARRHGYESLDFADAIDRETERLTAANWDDPSSPIYRYSYLARGLYADQLSRWFEHYERNQIHVVCSEEFFSNPQEVTDRVLNWLGLPKTLTMPSGFEARNSDPEGREIPQAVKSSLVEFFAPHNERLFALLDRRFDTWSTG